MIARERLHNIAAERTTTTEEPRPLHVFAPPLALLLTWWVSASPLPVLVWVAVGLYALLHLALIGLRKAGTLQRPIAQTLAMLCDVAFGVVLLLSPQLAAEALAPLFALLTLRALAVVRAQFAALLVPFLFGPLLVVAQLISPDMRTSQSTLLIILLCSLGVGGFAIWMAAHQLRLNKGLRFNLKHAQQQNEGRVAQLERTANDLRLRMRELHALEEGLRVITSTLSLDEVLNQIVESANQMLGPNRAYDLTLSLLENGDFEHLALRGVGNTTGWADLLAHRTMAFNGSLIINEQQIDAELRAVMPAGVTSVLSVPLLVGDGPPRGALTVLSTEPPTFSSSDARHLTAFAIQAGIAIGNAELHSRLRQQQDLFQSVVRDMSDGLVVIGDQADIVLTNPLGSSLLGQMAGDVSVKEMVEALAETARTTEKATVSSNLRLGNEEDTDNVLWYEAIATRISQTRDDEQLVAVVLHDITPQKDEERRQQLFISHVSHELRNPLHTINGYVKLVLSGRMGALTAMQQDFLVTADEQVEVLKGRIAELLEYNSATMRKMRLDKQMGNIPLLITGTINNLHLQAEQKGLQLVHAPGEDVPDFLFDTKRIQQVLTNLIENAMKATPPGGTITVSTEHNDSTMTVHVQDTGSGIPKADLDNIFRDFYRAHNHTSTHGSHLGLGLSIVTNIIDAHKGRIWVESEEGEGARFSFSLPMSMAELEREVNA